MKKKIIVILAIAFIILIIAVNSRKSNDPFYEKAMIKNSYNAMGEIIGEFSVCVVDKNKCTDEVIDDWYNNYVLTHDCDYYLIKYAGENKGIYAIKGMITKDCTIDEDYNVSGGKAIKK